MLRGETPRGRLFYGHETAGGDPFSFVDGSHWCEAVITAGKRGLLTTGAGRHGHPTRWDWGLTLKSLAIAAQRYERLHDLIDEMSPDQKIEMWSNPDMDELRRVALRESRLNVKRKDLS